MRKTVGQWAVAGALAVAGVAVTGCQTNAPAMPELGPPQVTVATPIVRTITDYSEFTGQTAAVEQVEVRARVSGYLVKIAFQDGQEVKAGDPLFQIDPAPFEADRDKAAAEAARAKAMLIKAKSDLSRGHLLRQKNAITQADLESYIAQADMADASLKADLAGLQQAQLNLGFTRITAPINGRASRTNITVGNLIQPGPGPTTVLTTIVRMDPMYVYFNVDERTMLRYQQLARETGKDARPTHIKQWKIPVEIGLDNEKGFPHQGILDFVDNRVDAGTGTIPLRGVFDNADRALTPELFTRVRLPFGDPHQALMVTERALGNDQGQKFVYTVSDKNEVVYRPLKLGSLHEGLRVIEAGLKPQERVIVNGLQRVRPGVVVRPTPGQML